MNNLTTWQKQRGATLLISLILLLVLTILALVAGRSATLQQRMASNLQQQNLAFQSAESGIQIAILKLIENQQERPAENTAKCLSATDIKATANWNTCPAGTPANTKGYFVRVEREESCGGGSGGGGASSIGGSNPMPSGGTCYKITSTGYFENARATHQQGYMF